MAKRPFIRELAFNRGSAIPVFALQPFSRLFSHQQPSSAPTQESKHDSDLTPTSRTKSRPNPWLNVEPPALYMGATRVRTVEVHVDDVLATTWTSSGTVDGFEAIDLSGYSGRYLTVMSLQDDMEWLSIVEVSWAAASPRYCEGMGYWIRVPYRKRRHRSGNIGVLCPPRVAFPHGPGFWWRLPARRSRLLVCGDSSQTKQYCAPNLCACFRFMSLESTQTCT